MIDSRTTDSLDVRRYTTVLRRRWLIVVLFVLLGEALAGALLLLRPVRVTATALVNLHVISSELFSTTRSASEIIDAQTESQLARSSPVVSAVSKSLPFGRSPRDVRDAITAELLPDGTVLKISYTDGSWVQAAQGADAVAREYLSYRSRLAQGRLDSVIDQLSARRDNLRAALITTNKRLSTAPRGSIAHAEAESDRQLLNLELDSLFGQLNAVRAIDTSSGTILASAAETAPAVSPPRGLVMAGGALAGLLVGIVGAFAINARDRRLRDAYDVAEAGGGPLLSRIESRSASVPPSGTDLEAIRSLRERLLASLPESIPVLTVDDLTGETAPSDIGPNLALTMAETGMTVQLVLPICSPELKRYLVRALRLRESQAGTTPGLYHSTLDGRLLVKIPASPTSSADTPSHLTDLFDDKHPVDITVLVLPPDSSPALRMAAGRLGWAFVWVATETITSADQLVSASAQLRAVGGVVLGTVLVPADRRLRILTPETLAQLTDNTPSELPSPSSKGQSSVSGYRSSQHRRPTGKS